jgi:hypothetical protein
MAWTCVLERALADTAATLMRDRALGLVAAPPPADWDGVTVATDK